MSRSVWCLAALLCAVALVGLLGCSKPADEALSPAAVAATTPKPAVESSVPTASTTESAARETAASGAAGAEPAPVVGEAAKPQPSSSASTVPHKAQGEHPRASGGSDAGPTAKATTDPATPPAGGDAGTKAVTPPPGGLTQPKPPAGDSHVSSGDDGYEIICDPKTGTCRRVKKH